MNPLLLGIEPSYAIERSDKQRRPTNEEDFKKRTCEAARRWRVKQKIYSHAGQLTPNKGHSE